MKNIFISIPYGMSARNLLRNNFLKIISENNSIYIFTPLYADKGFREEFQINGNIRILPLKFKYSPVTRLLSKWLIDAETYPWQKKNNIQTHHIFKQTIRLGYADSIISWYAGVFSMRSKILSAGYFKKILRFAVESLLRIESNYRKYYQLYDPALTLFTHPQASEERGLYVEAKRHKTIKVGMIHSWDNITSKHKMLFRYDKMIVWNDILKDELIELYDYPTEDIYVCGIPQYDIFADDSIYIGRQAFFNNQGLDESKELITFACACPDFVPAQHEILKIIIDAIESGSVSISAQILIRLHPGRKTPELEELARYGFVHIDRPPAADTPLRLTSGWDSSDAGRVHYANLLHYSDLLINSFSTTTVDAAAHDTPVINIAFDGNKSEPYFKSVRKHYDWNHYRPIVESGGARIVYDSEQLIDSVNMYLRDSNKDKAGRRKIMEMLNGGPVDGRSGERIADCILKMVGA